MNSQIDSTKPHNNATGTENEHGLYSFTFTSQELSMLSITQLRDLYLSLARIGDFTSLESEKPTFFEDKAIKHNPAGYLINGLSNFIDTMTFRIADELKERKPENEIDIDIIIRAMLFHDVFCEDLTMLNINLAKSIHNIETFKFKQKHNIKINSEDLL